MFGNVVEHRQQLAHAGDLGNILALAGHPQALVAGVECRVVSYCRDGGHVQRLSHIGAPTPDATLPTHLARVAVQGRHADQRGMKALQMRGRLRFAIADFVLEELDDPLDARACGARRRPAA